MQVLQDEGNGFSFFQVARLIQMFHPKMARVGRCGPPQDEPIRFRPDLDMSFPSSDVKSVRSIRTEMGEPRYEVTTTFMGLYGSCSPLPSYFTERLLDDSAGSELIRGFLDLFHHRIISLFYRAWEKYSLPPPDTDSGGDLTSDRLLALTGIDRTLDSSVEWLEHPWALLAAGGLSALLPRSAASLEGVLRAIFPHLHARVEQFVGRWVDVPRAERNRLARSNCRLGMDLTLGERVFSYLDTFRIHIGPVYDEVFLSLGPRGKMFRRLDAVVSLFNQDRLDFEVELLVYPDGIPDLRLGSESPRLGWSAWIGRKPAEPQIVRFLVKG